MEDKEEKELVYWHATCTKCSKEKNEYTSHCKSRMCPWCSDCCPRE